MSFSTFVSSGEAFREDFAAVGWKKPRKPYFVYKKKLNSELHLHLSALIPARLVKASGTDPIMSYRIIAERKVVLPDIFPERLTDHTLWIWGDEDFVSNPSRPLITKDGKPDPTQIIAKAEEFEEMAQSMDWDTITSDYVVGKYHQSSVKTIGLIAAKEKFSSKDAARELAKVLLEGPLELARRRGPNSYAERDYKGEYAKIIDYYDLPESRIAAE